MRDHLDHIDGTSVALLTFAPPSRLADHRAHLELPFPVLADVDRSVYRAFDLGRGPVHRIWNPGTLRLYAKLLRRGRRLQRPTEDTRQLGGDFVIDPAGRLAAGFWPRSPDDRPAIDTLIEAVHRARAG